MLHAASRIKQRLHKELNWFIAEQRGKATYLRGKQAMGAEQTTYTPTSLGARTIPPEGDPASPFTLPPQYREWIDVIAHTANTIFDDDARHEKHASKVDASVIFTKWAHNTVEIPAVRELAAHMVNLMERHVYGSFVHVRKVSIYRSMDKASDVERSELWHTDNNNDFTTKLLIYLTDTELKHGPFEYLFNPTNATCPRIPGAAHPRYPGSRVPENVINQYLENGHIIESVVGPRGTMLIFDNKIIHRRRPPEEGIRDALMMQFEPCAAREERGVTARTTHT